LQLLRAPVDDREHFLDGRVDGAGGTEDESESGAMVLSRDRVREAHEIESAREADRRAREEAGNTDEGSGEKAERKLDHE
jgi:hypothetical protein